MHKNRVKGATKQAEGKVQEAKDALTNNARDRVAGRAKQVAGKVQKEFGKAKDDTKK